MSLTLYPKQIDNEDFACVVRASDGVQVLFEKTETEDGRPCLRQVTTFGGATAEFNLTFKESNQEASLETAFARCDIVMADAVRKAVKSMVGDQQGEPFEEAFQF